MSASRTRSRTRRTRTPLTISRTRTARTPSPSVNLGWDSSSSSVPSDGHASTVCSSMASFSSTHSCDALDTSFGEASDLRSQYSEVLHDKLYQLSALGLSQSGAQKLLSQVKQHIEAWNDIVERMHCAALKQRKEVSDCRVEMEYLRYECKDKENTIRSLRKEVTRKRKSKVRIVARDKNELPTVIEFRKRRYLEKESAKKSFDVGIASVRQKDTENFEKLIAEYKTQIKNTAVEIESVHYENSALRETIDKLKRPRHSSTCRPQSGTRSTLSSPSRLYSDHMCMDALDQVLDFALKRARSSVCEQSPTKLMEGDSQCPALCSAARISEEHNCDLCVLDAVTESSDDKYATSLPDVCVSESRLRPKVHISRKIVKSASEEPSASRRKRSGSREFSRTKYNPFLPFPERERISTLKFGEDLRQFSEHGDSLLDSILTEM